VRRVISQEIPGVITVAHTHHRLRHPADRHAPASEERTIVSSRHRSAGFTIAGPDPLPPCERDDRAGEAGRAEVSIPKLPPYPVGELATWQLRDYRAELETALAGAAAGSADHQLIRRRLAEVTTEQAERVQVPRDTS
jgi:hypothetical protein